MPNLAPAPSTSWPMPPFVRASIGLHALAIAAVVVRPETAAAALGAVVLNHLALTAAGLWPRSKLLGPNLTHLPVEASQRGEIALTIDDGPDPRVTPAVLDLLDLHAHRATFFCIADRVNAHPALARDIVERGHAIENHSASHHHNFSLLGPRGFAAEIGRAQDIVASVTGRRPLFFRAPAGLRNPFLDPVLHRLGLRLVSWTRRGFDTRERDPGKVLARLTRGLAAGDILLLHDGHAAQSSSGQAVVLAVLPRLLELCSAAGLKGVTLPEAMPAIQPGVRPALESATAR